jgi:hypothetical protein
VVCDTLQIWCVDDCILELPEALGTVIGASDLQLKGEREREERMRADEKERR